MRISQKDLIKISEIHDKALELIHSTDLNEDIIEMILKPLEDVLKENGINLKENDC